MDASLKPSPSKPSLGKKERSRKEYALKKYNRMINNNKISSAIHFKLSIYIFQHIHYFVDHLADAKRPFPIG